MLPRSVRARMTVIASVVVALALAGAGIALLVTLDSALEQSGDASARTRARDLAQLVQAGALPPVLPATRETDFAQVVDDSGAVTATTAGRVGPPLTTFRPTGPEPQVRAVTGPGEDGEAEDYRVWALRTESRQGDVTVYAGYSLESVGETLALLRGALAFGLPVLLGLLALATWMLVGRALRPVEAIRTEVADISAGELDRRVPVPSVQDEVGRLATTMNAMLDRLEAGARQQRRFVADASHELQSPLASLRAQLEVAAAHGVATDWERMSSALLRETQRMERLVRDLLFLARSDEASQPPPRHDVDLDDVVLEEVQRLRPATGVHFVVDNVSAAPVRGSRDELGRMARNLLENAVRHAVTTVTVTLAQTGAQVRLCVADDGPGVPAADRGRVFERFVRLDSGRSRRAGGTGLGLAIADDIARRHGGTVRLSDRPGGARFIVSLPGTDTYDAVTYDGVGKPGRHPHDIHDARPDHVAP